MVSTRFLVFTGADGSGKSTLARFAVNELHRRGVRASLVWSRFNNYLSKPLLALARLTGHSYYETHGGVRFGYHDFEAVPFYRYLFVMLQAVDVNMAMAFHLRLRHRKGEALVFDRGPWDTLADVMVDTGWSGLAESRWGQLFPTQIQNRSLVIFVSRRREEILKTRPELVHDTKLARKIGIYEHLARVHGWRQLDNNQPLALVKQELQERF